MAKPTDTSDNAPPDKGVAVDTDKPRRKRFTTHRFRWNVRLLLGIPVALALIVLMLMRSPLVGRMVASQIKGLTGCTLEGAGATGTYIDLDGRLVIRHFRLRLPGVPGDAGTVLSAEQAVVDLDWSGVFTGDVTPTAVRLSKPIFRVSQSIEDGDVNLAAIAAQASAGSGGVGTAPPKIDAMDGVVILAEHAKATGQSRTLKELHLSGSFMPINPTRPIYSIRFAETGQTRDKALLLDGRINLDTGAATLKLFNLAFDAWKPESIPTAYREQWRKLNVQGRISSAAMSYDKDNGATVEVTLDNVSMNALIPAESAGPGETKDLGLQAVSGTVGFSKKGLNATLTGRVEGQSGISTVRLTTQGTDIDAALSCEIIAQKVGVTKETELLPYIPARVREYFRAFSGPTGELDARVLISRGAPVNGQPAEIQVSGGRITLRHGVAAFHKFPYPFLETSGEFEFDDHSLRIVKLEGRGPSGAMLRADGLISPLTDEAMVDVNVHAEHVPVDKHLLDAMPKDRRRVLENVFSRPEYERLLADKLIRAPGAPMVENGPPEFALAGECSIDVHVHSPEGKDSPWFTTVDVGFEKAGMLVDPFPLPVIATGVKLHITDDDAKLISGTFRPLSGGTMDLSAFVTFFTGDKRETRPDVRIVARDVPVDALLLHALPRDEPAPAGTPAAARELSLGELMLRLNASGVIACDARVMADPTQRADDPTPTIAYDIGVDLAGVRCAPTLPGDAPAFSIEDFRGQMRLTRSALSIPAMESHLYRLPSPEESGGGPFVGPLQAASFSLSLEKRLSGDPGSQRGSMEGTLMVSEANLAAPIERFVGVFSPDAGKRLAAMRVQHEPTGRIHTSVHLKRAPGENAPMEVGVTLDNASNIEFAALGGRVGVDWPEGQIEIHIPAEGSESIRFNHVLARLTMDGAACGEAQLDGSVALDSATGTVAAPADLTAEFAAWRFESPLLGPLLQRLTSPGTADAYRNFNAVGPFDAKVSVHTETTERRPLPFVRVEAELSPRAMAFDWEGQRIACDEVTGKVTLRTRAGEGVHPVSGRFDALRVKTAAWDAAADGAWYSPAPAAGATGDRPVQLALTFDVSGRTLDPALRALMPTAAVDAIDALGAEFRGPFALRKGAVRTTLGDTPSPTSFTGDLDFTDLAFSIGVPIDRCTGTVSMRVDSRPPGSSEPTTFEVRARADGLRVIGINATSAEAIVTSGSKPGEILIPDVTAQCYGGRLSGHVTLQLGEEPPALAAGEMGPPAPAGPSHYDAELILAGVQLAPVLADAAALGATDPGPVGPPDPFTEPDQSRGVIDARLTVAGLSGDLSSRSGGGAIRISNGDIIKLPMMLPLIQVSNFQIPSKDRLGYMQSDFTITGDTAVFDHVSLLSDSVAIVGAGTLKWPGLNLDMKFNSRSNSRIPILSGVIEALRNEIVSTRVKGTLSAPVVSEQPFTGTRELLDRLLHPNKHASSITPAAPRAGTKAQQERSRIENATEATAMPNQP